MIELCSQLEKLGESFIEAGHIVLSRVRKDSRVWMCNMTRHELMRKVAPVVEEFLTVMCREEHSGLGHTWLKGKGYNACQANLATLGSHIPVIGTQMVLIPLSMAVTMMLSQIECFFFKF